MTKKLLSSIGSSSKKLEKASVWKSSKLKVSGEDSFIYEIYCLFRIVVDLLSNYDIRFVQGAAGKEFLFPKGPAQKQGWPRFQLLKRTNPALQWQLCHGTAIEDIHGHERYPDISLQEGDSPEQPNFSHVHLICDAKFQRDGKSEITGSEFARFGQFVAVLGVQGAQTVNLSFNSLTNLLGNCLLTNGSVSTEKDGERNRQFIKEVQQFFPKARYSVKP